MADPKTYHVVTTITGGDGTEKTIEGDFTVTDSNTPIDEDVPPTITVQPHDVIVHAGESATLTCEAVGDEPLAYQWFQGEEPLVGMTCTTLEVKPEQDTEYYCEVSNFAGTVESELATVTVLPVEADEAPIIFQQPIGMTVVSGQVVTLSVGASGTEPLSYQWRSGGTDIEGANAPSYTTQPLTANQIFDVVVTNAVGSVTSNATEMVVYVPVPTEGLGLKYVRTIGLPPLYMGYAYGDITGRKVNGATRLLFTGDWVGVGSPVYEVEVTPDPVATFIQQWEHPYHGRRGTYINTAGVKATIDALRRGEMLYPVRHAGNLERLRRSVLANWQQQLKSMSPKSDEWVYYNFDDASTPALNGGHFYDAEQDLMHVAYADSYNVAGRPDWNIVTLRLHPDGSSEAWGPWRMVTTDPEGTKRYGPRAGMYMRKHPSTGDMLTAHGMGSGNVGFAWGANLFGGAKWPSPGTAEMADLAQPDCYLFHYHMIGQVNEQGVAQGPVRSQRRPVHPALGEHFSNQPGNSEHFIDPLNPANAGVGSWTDNDSLGGFEPLPDRTYFFAGVAGSPIQDPANPLAAHCFYANGGNNFTCSHGHAAVPYGITGPGSTARFPCAYHYPSEVLEQIKQRQLVEWAQEPTAFSNLEAENGIITAPIDSVGNSKMVTGGYFDQEKRKLYLMAHGADRGTVTWGLINAFVHEYDVL